MFNQSIESVKDHNFKTDLHHKCMLRQQEIDSNLLHSVRIFELSHDKYFI